MIKVIVPHVQVSSQVSYTMNNIMAACFVGVVMVIAVFKIMLAIGVDSC